MGNHSPEAVLLGIGRVAALFGAYWIAGSTLVYTLAKATRIPALIRAVEWMTLPAVRRVAERAIAVSLTVSTLAGGTAGTALASETPIPEFQEASTRAIATPQTAGSPSSGYVPVPAGDTSISVPQDDEGDGYSPVPAGSDAARAPFAPESSATADTVSDADDAASPHGSAGLPTPAAQPSASTKSPEEAYEYVVQEHDNLWTAAEAHLSEVLDHSPSEQEIATYWSHMIDINTKRLRSGDPNLIFAGEVIVCPALADAGM